MDHLTIRERKLLSEHSLETLQEKKKKLELELAKFDPTEWEGEKWKTLFNDTLFRQYHPEIEELLKDPHTVKDPSDMRSYFTIGYSEPKTMPKTNLMRFEDIQLNWLRSELFKTKEYRRWQTQSMKGTTLKHQIRNVDETITEYQRVSTIPVKTTQSNAVNFLNQLLQPYDRTKKRKRDDDVTGIRGLILPQSSKHLVHVTKSSAVFGHPEAFEFLGKKNAPVAVLLQNGTIHIRDGEDWILDSLQRLVADPELYLSTEGKACGICLLCGRTLTDETSKQLGYGSVCAKHVKKCIRSK